jgi:septum site-determining protein MinC
MSVPLQIKGIKEGLLVTLGEGEWGDLQTNLLAHIQERASFFIGARVALDVGNHILRVVELSGLRDRLSEAGISLWAVLSNSPTTEHTAQNLGLATRLSAPRPERQVRTLDATLGGQSAILVQRTLRSGFKVSYPGHVVVVGDVNPGAEVIAGGSVVVWGKLRGVVHAGSEGNEAAVVCALDLSPTVMRIAGKSALMPPRKGKPLPEMARLHNGQVVAEAWVPVRK